MSGKGIGAFFSLFSKGVAMGAAEVVPGVSGGTIALLVGVYERLIESIRAASSPAVKEIFKAGGIPRFWRAVDGNFLVVLLLGMSLAVLLFSRAITMLIAEYPVQVWASFFGLIVASIVLVGKGVRWGLVPVIMALVGVVIGYVISTAASGSLPEGPWGLVLGGAISICAMILPGISGSFVLLILGRYHEVMGAVATLDFPILIPFAMGALAGLLAFSHVLSWLLRHYRNATIALLTGFMGGAIIKVWPWREQIGAAEVSIDRAISPAVYAATHGETHMLAAVGLAVASCALVLWIGYMENRKKA